ncbi:MAG: SpoIIE family protein phosphatase [Candidatus Baltobacteraceae bacterium]
MLWMLSVALNTVIAAAFVMIAYTAARGLSRSGQLTSNMLGVATAAMFASCAISHETHAVHMLLPALGLEHEAGMAMRRAIDWHLDGADSLTAAIALWYWTQRPKFNALLDGGQLFADLHQRLEVTGRALAEKGRIADALQRALAPKDLPFNDKLSFHAAYLPADEEAQIGGDWYDVFALPANRIGFMVGDVTGHGLEAAAITSRVRESIIAAAFANDDPSIVLQRVNDIWFLRAAPIVTATYGVVDLDTLHVRYATAGHPPPVFWSRAEGVRFAPHDGLPLGVERDAAFPTASVQMSANSVFVLYTDGVTEHNRTPVDGERQLLAAVRASCEQNRRMLARDILHGVLGRSRTRDDAAVLAIKFVGEPTLVRGRDSLRWTFDVADPEAANRLRTRVMIAVAEYGASGCDMPATELVLGELLANVVRHTPGPIVIELSGRSPAYVLSVTDAGPGFALSRDLPEDPLSEHGRGMFLIRALADDVEVTRAPQGGSTVRVVLPAARMHAFDGSAGPAVAMHP